METSIRNNGLENLLKIACKTDATVLITGPTGSGKSCLARQIHENGGRSAKPFVTVNLATLHEGTLESELFGHERGAFTGAELRRIGKLESAAGGTVFLDEIGDLSPRLQARLLEFLQSRTICPVGSNREIKLDVRVIAATHRNLSLAVARGDFREDLFHRLRVVSIDLKPLRDRWVELDEIVHRCLEEVCKKAGRSVLRISEDVARRIENHDWPGNFRELRNVLEFAVLAGDGPEITTDDLPAWFGEKATFVAENAVQMSGLPRAELVNHADAVAAFEKNFLSVALERYGWRINRTARKIGMNKTTLIRRIREYGLKPAMGADFG